MTENKRLNLDVETIEKIDSKYKTRWVDIDVEIEGEIKKASVEIDVDFRPTKIKNCVHEYLKNMDWTRKINRDVVGDLKEVYLLFMVIKHFSSFPAPEKYEEQVKVLQKMVDADILFQIYQEFEPSELRKVNEEIEMLAKVISENADAFKEMAKDYKFENPDLME